MQLKNKIALVTGSASGIGEAIARRLATEGARVMIHGLQQEDGERVAKEIRDAGGEADFFFAQLEDVAACESLMDATVARFGGIDILVNNAGAVIRSNLETTDCATFDRALAINARAPLFLIRAAMPHFRKAGGGRVLNIGSINAYAGEANLLAYSISKGALMTMTRNLADAHAHENVRINQINPGWVLTENEHRGQMAQGLPADWPQRLSRRDAPSGRILAPEEIAHFALAFVSDAAGPVSGAVVECEQFPVIGRNPIKEAK